MGEYMLQINDIQLAFDQLQRDTQTLERFIPTNGSSREPYEEALENMHELDRYLSRIWAAYEQVRSYEPILRWADVPTLHELRIAGKWLRYSLEFVQEPLGEDALPLIA